MENNRAKGGEEEREEDEEHGQAYQDEEYPDQRGAREQMNAEAGNLEAASGAIGGRGEEGSVEDDNDLRAEDERYTLQIPPQQDGIGNVGSMEDDVLN